MRSSFAEWLELAGGGRNPYLLRFVDQDYHGLAINIAGQTRNVDLPDDVYFVTTSYEHCIAEGIYRHGLYVFPNRNQVHIPNRQRLHPELWTAQVNVVFPTRVCKMCNSKHHDGFIHCIGCGTRFEPHTDFSGLTQGVRERDVAAREGRPFNVMSLAPRAATHASRQRGHTATGEERMQQSAGAGLAKKVRNVAKKINDRGGSRFTDLLSEHPWESYNYARHGLYVTTLEEIEIFQCIRTPNIGRENVTTHDARFAIAWREGAVEIDFARSCFLSWNDRFYKPEEAAIVIQATIRSGGQPPLRILRFNGEVCAFSDSSAAAIMSGLLDIFRRDLIYAKRENRESLPTIHVRSGLHISEGLASVSTRQLNEMLANTRFYHHIYDGSVQTKFNRAYPRGRERYSPAERLGRERQYSAPAREPFTSGWYTSARQAGGYMSAPPAPRTHERASGSGIARPTTPPKTPPKAPPRDPTTYISEQEFANIREGRYGRFDASAPAPTALRATATRSRSPKQRPYGEAIIPGKVASTRVRPPTPPQSTSASAHEAPPKAKARTMTPPMRKAPPGGARPPPSPKAATMVTEGRGPKAGTASRPTAIVPPPEKAGQPPLVLGSTRSDGTFVTFRGEPLPAVPKPKEGGTAAKAAAIPKAMPTDADTRPNNVSAERQAVTMTSMFRYIHRGLQPRVWHATQQLSFCCNWRVHRPRPVAS